MTSPRDEIRSVHHAVDVGVQLPDSWFRGHQKAVDALIPRLYWKYGDPVTEIFKPALEMEFIEAFRRDAHAMGNSHRLPDEDDYLGWMYLMRHYRAPTRLLDWTKNVLAALFFAVSDESKWGKQDGELWALHPWALNEQSHGKWGTPIYDRSPVIDYLAREPYWENHQALANEIAEEYRGRTAAKWSEDPKPFIRPVAFEPRRDFERMLVQLSVFTIHPKPTDGNRIPEILTDERELVRYMIPKNAKEDIWTQLRRLGVTDRALFPDFEGLSRTITPPKRRIAEASELPLPPKWSEDEETED